MRRILRFAWVIIAIGGVYLGWTYHARELANQAMVQRLKERAPVDPQKVLEAYGGDQLTILAFYGMPGAIRPGESAQLCYGVNNATAVRLDPPAEPVWPSLSRCVKVSPDRDTEYTLTAVDDTGKEKTARLTIKVR